MLGFLLDFLRDAFTSRPARSKRKRQQEDAATADAQHAARLAYAQHEEFLRKSIAAREIAARGEAAADESKRRRRATRGNDYER